jgi:mannose-6-phosphate isomerase
MLLNTRTVEKPWGAGILPAPFTSGDGERIGEIWFEPPPELPELLVKYIFTSEKLSVQVHPSDTQTQAAGLGNQGKEECWLVIAAEPDAVLGIGFAQPISADEMRAAALDGSIEDLLLWHPVKPGDFFYIPANTVHAIGGGCSIIEIQQNSDITYRLYDYGRPRELHLEESVAVAKGERYADACRKAVPAAGSATLVEGPYFRLDFVRGQPSDEVASRYSSGPLLVVPREGEATVAGQKVAPGTCALALSLNDVQFGPAGTCLITQPLPGARG